LVAPPRTARSSQLHEPRRPITRRAPAEKLPGRGWVTIAPSIGVRTIWGQYSHDGYANRQHAARNRVWGTVQQPWRFAVHGKQLQHQRRTDLLQLQLWCVQTITAFCTGNSPDQIQRTGSPRVSVSCLTISSPLISRAGAMNYNRSIARSAQSPMVFRPVALYMECPE